MNKFKRFLVLFCIASLMFTTCVFADTGYEYEEENVKSSVENLVSDLLSMNETELEYYAYNAVGWTKDASESLLSYKENDSLGDFIKVKDTSLTEKEQLLVVETIADHDKADLQIKVTLASISGSLNVTDIEFELIDTSNKSLGERMATAAFNTVIGVVSVFLVLTFISYVISLFKYIPKLQEVFAKKNNKSVEIEIENAISQIEEKEEMIDDTELVAVITAAICAATGSSSDAFVVRSIRKAERKKKLI